MLDWDERGNFVKSIMERNLDPEEQLEQLNPEKRDYNNFVPQTLMKKDLEGFAPQRLMKKDRVEICRDLHDRQSCKICASCVNFPGKQRDFSHNLRRTSRFTHTKCDFALKLLKVYTGS